MGSRFEETVANFLRSETSDWTSTHAVAFWESLKDKEKQEFLTVPVSELDIFSYGVLKVPWLTDFLGHAVVYFKRHNTWKFYACPKPGCLRFFKEDQSLIAHLKCEHISDICGINAWPFLHQDTCEESWCAQALRKMVWKPIDMSGALNLLTTMCLHEDCTTMVDVFAGSERLCSLNWPLSADPTRIKLLARLGDEFQSLLAEQERTGFSLLSNGHFSMLTALASKHVLVYVPLSDNVLFLGNLLAHSPLSFRFLNDTSLALFVELVSKIRHLVIQAADPSLHQESSTDEVNVHSDEILDVMSFSPDHNRFVLDRAKATNLFRDEGGLPSWLSNVPCCPYIAQGPTHGPKTRPSQLGIGRIGSESAGSDPIFGILERNRPKFCQIEIKLQLFGDRLHDFNMRLPSFIHHVKSTGLICSSGQCRECQLRYETLQFLPKVWQPERSHFEVNLLKDKLRGRSSDHPPCSASPCTNSLKKQIAFCSEIESHYLALVLLACELQCLKQQVRRVCALDFRMCIIWPLMKSVLRMRLYLSLKVRYDKLSDGKKTSVAKCTRESAQVEHIDEKTNGDGCNEDTEYEDISVKEEYSASESESEPEAGEVSFDCDAISESKTKPKPGTKCKGELRPEDKPWMVNSVLGGFDSTFSDTVWTTKDTNLFFCLEVSDIPRQTRPSDVHNSLWEGMSWFRLNKTWKYWHCYSCDRIFPDQESHAIHMDIEHLIHISHDERWLIPALLRQDGVQSEQYQLPHGQSRDEHFLVPGPIKQDDLQGDIGLEDSITMDNSYTYCLVDALKFFQMPSTKEGDESVRDKQIAFGEKLQDLQNLFTRLRCLFDVKRGLLRNLEVLCALRCMLLNGSRPLKYCLTLFDKFSSLEVHTETTHMLRLLCLDLVGQTHDTLCNDMIQEVCGMMEHDLLGQLDDLDREILQILAEGSNLKGLLYHLCVCDYRTDILPITKSIIRTRFALDGNLQSFVSTTIKGLLSSIGPPYIMKPEPFKLVPLSIGKVLINITEKETEPGFAYLGINLRFDGESFEFGSAKMGGTFQFAVLSTWGNDPDHRYYFRTFNKLSFDEDGGTDSQKDYAGVTPEMRESREAFVEIWLTSAVTKQLNMFEKKFEEMFARSVCDK